MILIKKIGEIRKIIKSEKDRKIGLVPTMGYLHEGHISLIKRAKENGDFVVVSIFINPSQFAPDEDFDNYPRDTDRDALICENAGVDVIFAPDMREMYPTGIFDLQGGNISYVNPNEDVAGRLCGKRRPTHFRGVMTVVAKLFNIITPDRAYFGQKDAQQLALVKNMASDLMFNVEIVSCPVIREKDGVAMSSRNTYLSPYEREQATLISKAISKIRDMIAGGCRNCPELVKTAEKMIVKDGYIKVEYLKIVDDVSLHDIEEICDKALIVTACYVGKTRLIDCMAIEI